MGDIKTRWLVFLLVIIMVGVIFWAFPSIPAVKFTPIESGKETTSTPQAVATTTPEAGWNIYKNTGYGFEIRYPQEILPDTTFKRFYLLSDSWRADDVPDSTGTLIAAFPIYRTESTSTYPRYFSAEVRIGVSVNSRDVSSCTSSSPYVNVSSTEAIINGTTFYKFPIKNAAMMQYLGGESFRTVHDGMCFAVEQLRVGSNYRDTTSSVENVDEALRTYFDRGLDIVKTFRFLD